MVIILFPPSAVQEPTANPGLIVQLASLPHFHTLSLDHETEHFSNSLLLINIAPSLLACCVILSRALLHLPYRSQWLSPFVQEQKKEHDPYTGNPVKRHYPSALFTFLFLSCVGLIAQLLAVVIPVQNLSPIPRALTWVSHGHLSSLP